jgi:glycosyltransferase involved in cell wall biosynthesis
MPADGSRNALIVAYFFPPLGGAGVQRVLKFVKYLPEHGYAPVVVTTRSRDYPARDPTLLAEVPAGTPILHASDPPLLRWGARGLDYLGLDGLRALAAWPDDAAAWIPAATVVALRAIKRHRASVIFSSAPPFSAHLVAWAAARASGLPWVADFRDEFSANPHSESRTGFVDRLSVPLERRIVRDAARVVTVADYFAIAGSPPQSDRRVTLVNGVDAADVPDVAVNGASDRFRLSFVGTLYGERDLAPVASALGALAAQGAIDPTRCELRIVGNMWLHRQPDAGLVPVVSTGYVSHQEAVAEMQGASVLLFYAPDSSPAPSGKIFEYLACERPILCVARRDNLAYRLVDDWSAGLGAEPGDSAQIESAIAALYSGWESGGLGTPAGLRARVMASYSRRQLAAELAAVLDDAVAAGAPWSDAPASRA